MPKRYLNREEKNLTLVVAAMGPAMESAYRLAQDKETLKYMRMAYAFIGKALAGTLQYLDATEVELLKNELNRIKFTLAYKSEIRAAKSRGKITEIETDDFLDFISHCIEGTCKTCTLTAVEVAECLIRKLYLKHEIEPLNCAAPEGECPYKYV